MTQAELLKQTAERIRSIADDTRRLTSGNVSHLSCGIRGRLLRNAELIERYQNGENKFDTPTRRRRLEILLEAAESLKREEPNLDLGDIPERVRALLLDEYRKLNWHVVSPIVNGCAQEAIYEGTPEDCKKYVQRLVEKDPAIKNNLIVTPV